MKPEHGAEYQAYLSTISQAEPKKYFSTHHYATELYINDFLGFAKQNHIWVIGLLPTTFNDKSIQPDMIQKLSNIYQQNHQSFLRLLNSSQSPRSCFYDTNYHLNEPCQIAHSTRLGIGLKALIPPAWVLSAE